MPTRFDRIPLFALTHEVCFPRTELHLEIEWQATEPDHRRLLSDLLSRDEDDRVLGAVLVQPEMPPDRSGRPEIFPGGTVARVVGVDRRPDGRALVALWGEVRFLIEHEIDGAPYRQARVRPVAEPELDEDDSGLVAVRREILGLADRLADETGSGFPIDRRVLAELAAGRPFEEVVNRLAADLDLPPLCKLGLLVEALPDRALELLKILRSRRTVVDLLRPFRHLAAGSELN
jgi:Lon protease-like protein